MENEKNYIDKLYSEKFSKFESKISTDDWAKLSTKLVKTNFLKFSFATFNAYFLGVIVSFASAATYLGVNNVSLSEKIEKLEDKIEVLQEQQVKNDIEPILLDTFAIEEPNLDVKTEGVDSDVVDVKVPKKTIEKTVRLPESTKSDSITAQKDTLILAKPDTSIAKPKKVIRRIKRQVYVKKDKVIITDTVKIKKRE